jgi:hypothetical protein
VYVPKQRSLADKAKEYCSEALLSNWRERVCKKATACFMPLLPLFALLRLEVAGGQVVFTEGAGGWHQHFPATLQQREQAAIISCS